VVESLEADSDILAVHRLLRGVPALKLLLVSDYAWITR
jgi:hypothetical protein